MGAQALTGEKIKKDIDKIGIEAAKMIESLKS